MGILFYIIFYYFLSEYTSTNVYFSTKKSKDPDFSGSIKMRFMYYSSSKTFASLVSGSLASASSMSEDFLSFLGITFFGSASSREFDTCAAQNEVL